MNTKQMRRMASGIAAAAVLATALAVPASAAVPIASSSGQAFPYGGDGYAGFVAKFNYADGSTASKIYLEADITNGASVPFLVATKNGSPVSACSVQASPLAVKCLFKTIRNGDELIVKFGVNPLDNTANVTAEPLWSTTGYVPGGNNSHGDAWAEAGLLVSSPSSDPNVSQGLGNTNLNTSTVNFGGNGQAAGLKNLPNGVFAYVNDNAGADGGNLGLSKIDISVNNGALATFQLVIVYPKGTSQPKGFEHVSTGYPTVNYAPCTRGQTSECFVWSNKNSTVTLYLLHNGTVRRTY